MSVSTQSSETPYLAFGAFLVDVRRRRVTKAGVPLALTGRVFDTLVLLLERRSEVVPKEDFFNFIWDGVAVEENNLARSISTLRKVLGEEPGDHAYIVTVPGRGYRFVADVTPLADNPVSVPRASHSGAGTSGALPAASLLTHSRKWLIGATAITVLAVGAWLLIRSPASVSQRRIWQLTFEQGLQGNPTWAPDGKSIAYSSDRAGNLDIWVQQLSGSAPIRVTSGPEQEWQPAWSPDGQRIVFRSERDGGGLSIVSPSGGAPRPLTKFGYRPRWSPSGKDILFDRANTLGTMVSAPELYVVGLDGGEPRRIAVDIVRKFASFVYAWHPDGSRVSLWGLERGGGSAFWTVSISDASALRSEIPQAVLEERRAAGLRFTDADSLPLPFTWSTTGDALYFEGLADGVRDLWRVPVNARTLAWAGPLDRLTTSAGVDRESSLSPDGHSLAFAVRNERVRLWSFPFDPSSGRITGSGEPITSSEVNALSPDVSPNGERVVFKVERGGRYEIHDLSLIDGRDSLLYSTNDQRVTLSAPRWAPDGEQVLVRRVVPGERRAEPEVVLLNSAGPEAVLSTLNSVLEFPFDWSADGKWILGGVRQPNRGPYSLAFFPAVQRGSPEAVRPLEMDTQSNLWQARISPDQRWVAFAAAKPGASRIALVPAEGGPRVSITDGDFFDDRPRWSPDGRVLYFLSNRTGFLNVWASRIDPESGSALSAPFQVTHFDSPVLAVTPRMLEVGIAISSSRLILPMMQSSGNIWVLQGIDR